VAQPQQLGLEARLLGHDDFAEVGGKAGVVDAQQDIALAT
jgi:hypothetical protein